jgi:C4-dicarboxylate transporter DctM subunit
MSLAGILFFAAVLLLFALGAPLFVLFGAASMYCLHFLEGNVLATIIGDMYQLVSNPVLVAIPLFTFAGYILAESGMPGRLVRMNRALAGWLPGSLPWVTLLSCAVFTALTGASGVTIVAVGGLLLPALVKDGYSERFSLGMVTSSGSIGLLFPPSIPVILYGVVARVEIEKIFLAGVLPGLLIIVVLALYGGYTAMAQKVPRGAFSLSELLGAVRACLWEIPLPLFIVGGIYGGFATVTEVAAVTVAYAFVVEVCIYREISWSHLGKICLESGKMVGAILVILSMALAFAKFVILHNIPDRIVEFMSGVISEQLAFMNPKLAFLLLLNLLLLVVGCLMDIFSAIMVVVPLILPIALTFGVDPLHLAIIFLVNLEIGYCTPPVGLNLFIASFRFRKSMVSLYSATLPFLLLRIATLILITYWEPLSLAFK